jgi:AcrR family transcriptional regulator
MIEAAGELGYANTPVSEVIARAGVSRKAFYEHFPNREGCFLEASAAITEATIELLEGAYRAAEDPQRGAEAAIQALFEQGIANPAAVRLVLVELGALGAAGIDRCEQLIVLAERLLHEFVGLESTVDMPNPILRSIIGGMNQILYTRACARNAPRAPALIGDLVTWMRSYHPAPDLVMKSDARPSARPPGSWSGGRAPGTLSPAPIPRGRGRRRVFEDSQGFMAHSQRERILDAVANLSATKGYTAVTIGDIGEEAGCSADTIYAHFAGKEDVFIFAYEAGHGKSVSAISSACEAAPDSLSGIRAGIGALFDFLACEPSFAYLALVDALVVTTRTTARARRGLSAFERMFLHTLEKADHEVPSLTVEAIMGGLFELCLTHTLQRRTWELPSLVGPATYFALAPIIGMDAAAQVAVEPS